MASLPDNLTLILFSGGDAPGMNALLRAAVRLAINRHALAILGVMDGYKGLVRTARRLAKGEITIEALRQEILEKQGEAGLINATQDLILMTAASVTGIVVQGGIKLRSARCKEFQHKVEVRQMVISMLQQLGVKNIIVCGGDGSLKGAECLRREGGFKVVGVPGTIDNDLPVTEMALGVQSAVATVVWAVDHFKDTARSHRRVMVLETMGRHSGELTQLAAIASGAEFALIPEEGKITEDIIRTIAAHISSDFKRGRTHTIVLVAEGVEFEPPAAMSPAYQLAKALEKFFGAPLDDRSDVDVEVRPSVLGHLQRGGRPDPGDAILAARFAEAALASLISNSCKGGIVAQRDGTIRIVSFDALDDQRDANLCRNTASLQKALSGWGQS